MKFKLGDRVKGKAGLPRIGGKAGTVVEIGKPYGVEFDEPVESGHELDNPQKYKIDSCRWVFESDMELLLPYFADARVEDSTYSTTYGDGTITTIDIKDAFPLIVAFKNGYTLCYTLEGYTLTGIPIQSLFYSKPIFALPPPPKRKVKKVIQGWVNLYDTNLALVGVGLVHPTKNAADLATGPDKLGEACFIRHEYEVEEQGGQHETK